MSRDILYDSLVRPLLFNSDPEDVHHFAQTAMKALAPVLPALSLGYKKDDLAVSTLGSRFSNPIGLAAGFDKNASLIEQLPHFGFSFVEIGSVCAQPHGGNDKPRLFRLPEDSGLINRLGLNGLGVEVVATRLERLEDCKIPFGINIAKTNKAEIKGDEAVEDIAYTFDRIKEIKNLKYVTINTSCPNTHEGCLKESEQLARVLDKISPTAQKLGLPLLVKLSSDSEQAFTTELVNLSTAYKVTGFVCGNTSTTRDGLNTSESRLQEIGHGGLSGKPLKERNLNLTRLVQSLKKREQLIIGVGGIMTGQDAFEYLSAGAELLQIYTGFVYRGPSTVKLICEELSAILKNQGLSLSELKRKSEQNPQRI